MQEQQSKSESVFSHNLQANTNKSYVFDIRQVSSGKKYILITEYRLNEDRPWRNKLVVFPDHLEDFCQALEVVRTQLAN